MSKIAIIIFADTDSIEALGRVSNAFMLAGKAAGVRTKKTPKSADLQGFGVSGLCI